MRAKPKRRIVSIDNEPAMVIAPHKFKSGKEGYFGRQSIVVDGKPAFVQVILYYKD